MQPRGRWYRGYGWYRADEDAYQWLSFTAIALKFLDNLNEQQQREHEAAQVKATRAQGGEKIIWHDGGALGAVTVLRDGISTTGRYCREFQQEITIVARTSAPMAQRVAIPTAVGTSCRPARVEEALKYSAIVIPA